MKETVKEILLPENVEASFNNGILTVKGAKGIVEKKLKSKKVNIKVEDKIVSFSTVRNTRREKKLIGSFMAHTRNMIKGVTKGHYYKMKICAGHFPMNVSVTNNELIIKNFLGEKVPRKIKLLAEVKIRIEGNEIIIESASKELAGQTASRIEEKTKRAGFDKRIFQDGIFIMEKG